MPPVTLAINENLLAPSDDIRVLLFDWDGTLFDNHHFNFIALAHGLNTHGVSITEDWFHENSGFSARGIVEEAIRLADSDASADEVLASRDGYAEDRVGDIAPVAPVHDLLANPQGRPGGRGHRLQPFQHRRTSAPVRLGGRARRTRHPR